MGDLYPSFKRVPENKIVDLYHKKNISDSPIEPHINEEIIEFGIELPKMLSSSSNALKFNSTFGCTVLQRQNGVAIMYCESSFHILRSPNTVPQGYRKLVSSFASIPSVFIFCSIRVLSIPILPDSGRSMKVPAHYLCVVRFGFMEEILINPDLNDAILNSIPDVHSLMQKIKTDSKLIKPDDIPILHIFERNSIKSHTYLEEQFKTKNPFVWMSRYIRKVLINQVYAPLSSISEYNDELISIDDEHNEAEKKLFIGEVVKI